MAVLHAPGNTGKSLLALDWACHLTQGFDWIGNPIQPTGSVYAALEDAVGRRIAAWQEHHATSIGDKMMWILNGVTLRDASVVDQIIETSKRIDGRLVVIDTLARAMPAFKEVASEEMSIVTDAADRIRHEANATALILHHEPHHADRARGHSSLYDNADAVFRLRRIETTAGAVELSCTKQRNGERPNPVLLQIIDVTDEPGSIVIKPAGANVGLSQLAKSARSLGQLIGQQPELHAARFSELRDAAERYLGMNASTFKYALNKLVAKGFLTKFSEGRSTRYMRTHLLPPLPMDIRANQRTKSGHVP